MQHAPLPQPVGLVELTKPSQATGPDQPGRSAKPSKPTTVPLLREELRLIAAAHNADGSPAWLIHDPILNKFFRIDWLDFEILSRWLVTDIGTIVNSVNSDTTLQIDDHQVLSLAAFLQHHHLLQANSAQAVASLALEANRLKPGLLSWLVHHYLFFRVPLIRPQALLAAVMPFLRWIFSPATAVVVAVVTISGLYLVTRQWDVFAGTFVDQLTYAGLLSFGVALVFSKCIHELGHAITATRYGVRVAHMGIAMLVMFPMPYTDTSESWKLSNPRQRMLIASAGIIAELALAGFATLAWSLAQEGALKSALFFLSFTSWVLTLAVNMSPFMRFDGYFILSDLLDFPNLHERSAAMARTWMRRVLLGIQDAWPEEFAINRRRAVIGFATVTWFYRITVFIGIAWLVYYYFFKVLGIVLFTIEILWFVILPIWREIKVWHQRRAEIKTNRKALGLGLLVVVLLLGMIPWHTSVQGAAWLHATQQTVIYAPLPGKLVSFVQAGPVKKGDSLFRLNSQDLALDAARSQALSDARGAELRGLSGLEEGESQRAELQFEQQKYSAEVKLYKDELLRLDLTAPFSGVLQDVDDHLTVNTWIHPKQALATLFNPRSWAVDVMVEESDISRVKVGDKVQIYLQQSYFEKYAGTVIEVDAGKLPTLPHAMLDAQFGGAVATLPGDKHVPVQALYKVRVAFQEQPRLARMALGTAAIQTEAQAWLPSLAQRVVALLVRESGF